MAIDDARKFLEALENDLELKNRLLACGCEEEAREVIRSTGKEFTRAELYEAAGVTEPQLSERDKAKLREMDRHLRANGREGINPLAFTAYSMGIN